MNHVLTCFRVTSLALLALFYLPQSLLSQTDLEGTIAQMNSQRAEGYMQPFADLVGANVNTGFYHSASIPQSGFNIEFSLIGIGSTVSDEQKSFQANAPSGFDPATFQTATIFGGKGVIVTDAVTGLQYSGSDGLINTSLFPGIVPQLKLGSVLGTEAIIRFIVVPEIEEVVPQTSLFGIGARHSISQYFSTPPVDIAVGVFYSKFIAEDLLDYDGIAAGVQASKAWDFFSLYGGVQWENSMMNVKYTSSDPTITSPVVDINLTGANTFRLTMGGGLSLGLFKLFVDANFGSVTAFSGGIGIGS